MPRPPAASSPQALERMKRQKREGTKPEIALRKELFARGLRYRVDRPVLPKSRRRADVVFTRAKVAVFVHGCFWHACPVHGTKPKANAAWWQEKLARNVERDRETRAQLETAGWAVVELWEHGDPVTGADEVERVVKSRRPLPG